MMLVVDQNFMRRSGLRKTLTEEPTCRFVVPDVAFEEMTQHNDWESTIRNSFRSLAPTMDRVFISAGLGELLRYELRTDRPITHTQLLPNELTMSAREFIGTITEEGPNLASFRYRVEAARSEVGEESKNDDIKSHMSAHVALFSQNCGPGMIRAIRNGRMGRNARLGFLKSLSEMMIRQHLNIDTTRIGSEATWTRITVRFFFVKLWYREYWLRSGGLDQSDPKMIARDERDSVYVVTGSYFDDLLTNDRRAKECSADLRLAVDPCSDDELRCAFDVFKRTSGFDPLAIA